MESLIKTLNCIVLSQKSVIYPQYDETVSTPALKNRSHSKPKSEQELDFYMLKVLHI